MEAENDLIFIKSYGSIVDLQYVSSSVGLPWGLRGKKKTHLPELAQTHVY